MSSRAGSVSTMGELCFNTFNHSAFFDLEVDISAQIDAAADAGFPWIGLDVMSLDQWAARGRSIHELRDQLEHRGLGCWEITGVSLSDHRTTMRRTERLVAQAEVLRPHWILTNGAVPVDDACIATFRDVCDALATVGARPAVEYLPFTPLIDIATATRLVDSVGRDRAGILLDTWHHFRGPDTDDALVAVPLDLVAYIQFDDAPPLASDDLAHETVHRRVLPGDGEFDLYWYCDVMRSKGFDGVFSVEILSAAWRAGDVGEFARRVYETSRIYW